MELNLELTREDYQAYYEASWHQQKTAQRSNYYFALVWYLAVLGLATFLAVRHKETFAACIFLVLASYYLWQNWSFQKRWQERVEAYGRLVVEGPSTLVIDEAGLTERFLGIQLQVPWSQINHYTVHEDHLFIFFLKHRALIIPFRHVPASQRGDLMQTLERHQVQKKA